MVTDDFTLMLSVKANRYSEQFMSSIARPITKHAQFQYWKPVIHEKIKFVGLRMLTEASVIHVLVNWRYYLYTSFKRYKCQGTNLS
jgi:hypothetical protein